jgi:hypothetical protein
MGSELCVRCSLKPPFRLSVQGRSEPRARYTGRNVPRIFPRLKSDGSFAVRIRFSAAPKDGLANLVPWLDRWSNQHTRWSLFGTEYALSDIFAQPPRASIGATDELVIDLFGAPTGLEIWRDLYVELVRDTIMEFPEVGELRQVLDLSK